MTTNRQQTLPRDARLVALILAQMGVETASPAVMTLLMEFAHRPVSRSSASILLTLVQATLPKYCKMLRSTLNMLQDPCLRRMRLPQLEQQLLRQLLQWTT